MRKKPPDWRQLINNQEILSKILRNEELRKISDKAQEKYVPWDVFRHYKFPENIKPEEAWLHLKLFRRQGSENTPIVAIDGTTFTFSFSKALHKKLTIIDTHAAGLIKSLSSSASSAQKEQLIISSLTEEAIASSQIEGANTSRKVAKEMLYSGRKPKNISEQMIINNYQVMQLLDDLKDLDLTDEMLLDIQNRITRKTLTDESAAGRFRIDSDEIAVIDRISGEIAFIPPVHEQMRAELTRLIEFANSEDSSDHEFLHPFLKAVILHFWIGYLHPFVDGNGRTARAIFYWYLLKRGYWLFKYLSVSRVIKGSKRRYDQAFLDSEIDDNDLTFFIQYITEVTCRAIDEMRDYYQRKIRESEEYRKVVKSQSDLNERQIALLKFFYERRDEVTDIKTYQAKNGVVYETARNDLKVLKRKGYVVETEQKNKKVYIPNIPNIRKLLKKDG